VGAGCFGDGSPSGFQGQSPMKELGQNSQKHDIHTHSVSIKEIFQRVTDPWSLTFVRQREN